MCDSGLCVRGPVCVCVALCECVSVSICLALALSLCVSSLLCPVPHSGPSPGYLQSSPPVLTTNLSSCEKRMLVTCAECPKYRLCLACGTGQQLRDGTRQSSVPGATLTPRPFHSLGAARAWTALFGCCRSCPGDSLSSLDAVGVSRGWITLVGCCNTEC